MSRQSDTQTPMLGLAFASAMMALFVSYSVDAEPLAKQSVETAVDVAMEDIQPHFEMPTLAPSAIVINERPTHRIEEGAIQFFFVDTDTALARDADDALLKMVNAAQAGQRLKIVGFHRKSDSSQKYASLSRNRAAAVHQRLLALGAPASSIQLEAPIPTSAIGSSIQARRVEVSLLY